jgi:hypothetical protein
MVFCYLRYELIQNQNKPKTTVREITKTWVSGQNSCTLVIPKSIVKEYGLDKPSHVVVEGTDKGILIRKVRIDEIVASAD